MTALEYVVMSVNRASLQIWIQKFVCLGVGFFTVVDLYRDMLGRLKSLAFRASKFVCLGVFFTVVDLYRDMLGRLKSLTLELPSLFVWVGFFYRGWPVQGHAREAKKLSLRAAINNFAISLTWNIKKLLLQSHLYLEKFLRQSRSK